MKFPTTWVFACLFAISPCSGHTGRTHKRPWHTVHARLADSWKEGADAPGLCFCLGGAADREGAAKGLYQGQDRVRALLPSKHQCDPGRAFQSDLPSNK